jgi:hypothetical protein
MSGPVQENPHPGPSRDQKRAVLHQIPSNCQPVLGREPRQWFVNNFHGFHTLIDFPQSDKLIGVHCTHGLNRTGYLICRFLIQEQGWTAKQAIECWLGNGNGVEEEFRLVTNSLRLLSKVLPPLAATPSSESPTSNRCTKLRQTGLGRGRMEMNSSSRW